MQSKVDQIQVTRDTEKSMKGKQIMSDRDFAQGPINLDSLSHVQALRLAALAQAKASEDLLKSHTEDSEVISLVTSVLEKILPSF